MKNSIDSFNCYKNTFNKFLKSLRLKYNIIN